MRTDYLTYDDMVQHLAAKYQLTLSGVVLSHVITAVRESYRNLFGLHEWQYFRRFELINILAPYSTGTVTYSHANRTVALTDGVWPSAAAFGDLEIGDTRYLIQYRKSDTELVLPENFNPGADISVATGFEWVQQRYPLSFEVGDIVEIMDPDHPAPLRQIDVRGAMFLSDSYNTQTFPSHYVLFPSQQLPGTREVWFPSAVYADRSVKIMFDTRHRPLSVRYESGTNLAVDGSVATFPADVLQEKHIGCVLRVSTNTDAPTGPAGKLDTSDATQEWLHHPADFERIIVAIEGNNAVLSAPISPAVSDRAWSVSQLIDTDAGSMTTLMMRLAEEQYSIVADINSKQMNQARVLAMEQLILAQADDSTQIKPSSRVTPGWFPTRVSDIASTVK